MTVKTALYVLPNMNQSITFILISALRDKHKVSEESKTQSDRFIKIQTDVKTRIKQKIHHKHTNNQANRQNIITQNTNVQSFMEKDQELK